IEKKFLEAYKIKNLAHFIACSNNIMALKLDNSDRRWLVVVVTEHKQSEAYWNALHDFLENDGGRKMKYWAQEFAKTHPLVSKAAEAPLTKAKADLIEDQYSPGQKMIAAVFHFIRNAYHNKDEIKVDDHHVEAKRVIEYARQSRHFIMFDNDGVAAIKA